MRPQNGLGIRSLSSIWLPGTRPAKRGWVARRATFGTTASVSAPNVLIAQSMWSRNTTMSPVHPRCLRMQRMPRQSPMSAIARITSSGWIGCEDAVRCKSWADCHRIGGHMRWCVEARLPSAAGHVENHAHLVHRGHRRMSEIAQPAVRPVPPSRIAAGWDGCTSHASSVCRTGRTPARTSARPPPRHTAG